MSRALKIAAVILALSLVVPMAAVFSEALFFLVIVALFALFPGKDAAKPRLLKIMPWLWGLSFAASVAVLAARAMGKELIPNDGTTPAITQVELIGTIVVTPLLLRAFLMKKRFFPHLLIASSAAVLALSIHEFATGTQGPREIINLAAEVATEALLTAYLVLKFPAYARSRDSADPASP